MGRLWTFLIIIAVSAPGCPSSKPASTTVDDSHVKTAPVDAKTQMVRDLAALRFDRLGNPVLRWDHIPSPRATRERPHKLLVVMVEFSDRGFDRFKGEPDQGDKLARHYQKQLFDENYARVNSLSHYYATQSRGLYHLTGHVLPPIKLSKPRSAYGSPTRPAGGSWRNDGDTEGMVEEALLLAAKTYKNLAWSDFDRWDPSDFDKDGNIDEPDGYLDHFVLVFAGGGQSSCQLLNQLGSVFTPNAGPEAFDKLDKRQRECADRLWPHRFQVQRREGQGPRIGGVVNARGGVSLSDSLWVFDYNMQSEYITSSTFIHEFGHSIGLPDIYSRTSSNSTGGWEVMSSTASPSPQNLSAWSRLMLGWLKPKVVLPPSYGGAAQSSAYLRTLDDTGKDVDGSERALLVVLPPKLRKIELTTLPAASGTSALYSGQGNDMKRTAQLSLDLRAAKPGPIELSFDAWWEIEAGWDFAYFEVSVAGGAWSRRRPKDARHMPAKHGHDGKNSLPGFTGLSGDLDGDGKNESNAACDPTKKLAHGEEQAAAKKSSCRVPSWVRPVFDLSDLRGKQVRVRLRYFTDTAAVESGILIDNVRVTGLSIPGDFEAAIATPWKLDGFSRSPGHHEVLVPHFYLIEHRDPYAATARGMYRYDAGLARPYYHVYWDPTAKKMTAVQIRTRPGVVVWYYNGAYAWSENDPATNGPGKGFLLALDANPSELPLPGLESLYKGSADARDTHYETKTGEAQTLLRAAYYRTVCFARNPSYLPKGGVPADAATPGCGKGKAPMDALTVGGKKLMYSYQIGNDYLPGAPRAKLQAVGELYDEKRRDGNKTYRMRDRSLRYVHTQDGSFSVGEFADGIIFYDVTKDGLKRTGARAYPAVSRFDDSDPARWMNKKLPFGGVAVASEGFSFELAKPSPGAPAGAQVRVNMTWKKK